MILDTMSLGFPGATLHINGIDDVLRYATYREKEAAWLNGFLDQRDKGMQQGPAAKFYPSIKTRIDRLRGLLEKGDWDLDTVATTNRSVEADAPQARTRFRSPISCEVRSLESAEGIPRL